MTKRLRGPLLPRINIQEKVRTSTLIHKGKTTQAKIDGAPARLEPDQRERKRKADG